MVCLALRDLFDLHIDLLHGKLQPIMIWLALWPEFIALSALMCDSRQAECAILEVFFFFFFGI